jgi:protocatechuate 3,4-dioxygenase beta subunit
MRARIIVLPTALIILNLGAGVVAQVPVAPAPPGPPSPDARVTATGTSVIRGRVTAADTGQPLRRVRIRVDADGENVLIEPQSVTTDDEGRYEVARLTAGRYQLSASKGGYVSVQYGQRLPFESGRPIELRDGQLLDKVDVTLPRGGVVTGRVIDEAGEPVVRANVMLGRYRYENGLRRLTTPYTASTNDRGEFRTFGIPPGEYYLAASFGESDLGSAERIRYVRTFYPGTASVDDAQRVIVGPGDELSGITVSLIRARTVELSGTVRMGDGGALQGRGSVWARPKAGDSDRTHSGIVMSDGSFTIRGLLPGAYTVDARTEDGRGVTAAVTVSDADLTGVALVISQGATARGRIRFDAPAPPAGLAPSQVIVEVTPPSGEPLSRYDGPNTAHADWTFEITGVVGRQLIYAGTIGRWQLKSVRVDGRDVTDTPLDFGNGDVDGLEVLLSDRTTAISGRVTDARGVTVIDATVVMFAQNMEKWGPRSRYISSARLDQQGRFTIEGLPPGEYAAIALDYLEPGDERDPDLLEEWQRAATAVTLAEGEARTLDLRLSTF